MSDKKPMKTLKRTPVRESDVGVYVWKRSCNGKFLADDQGNVLNIPSVWGDLAKMAELQRVARFVCNEMGIDPEGTAIFWEQHRCTEEEYLEQLYEMENGILSDTNIKRK